MSVTESQTSNVIIHIHVPKCAGTSLNAVFKRKYRDRYLQYVNVTAWEHYLKTQTEAREAGQAVDDVAVERAETLLTNWKTYLNATPAYRDEHYDAVCGHLYWGHHENFARQVKYVSIVRPVVDRIVSFFNFLQSRPEHPGHASLKENLCSLNDLSATFLEKNPQIVHLWGNYFCRAYSGRQISDDADYKQFEQSVLAAIDRQQFICGTVGRVEHSLKELSISNAALPFANKMELQENKNFEVAETSALSSRVLELLHSINKFDMRLIEAIREKEARQAL
ncbi:hypothetical protein ACTL6U_04615 [Rhodovibrionaceae bacterium A322]